MRLPHTFEPGGCFFRECPPWEKNFCTYSQRAYYFYKLSNKSKILHTPVSKRMKHILMTYLAFLRLAIEAYRTLSVFQAWHFIIIGYWKATMVSGRRQV